MGAQRRARLSKRGRYVICRHLTTHTYRHIGETCRRKKNGVRISPSAISKLQQPDKEVAGSSCCE